MARDGHVALVRQPRRDEAAARALWPGVRFDERKEPFEHHLLGFVSRESGRPRRADETRTARQQRDRGVGGGRNTEQLFLRHAAGGHELPEAAGVQLVSRVDEPGLARVCEREVHVVTAEQQMWADRDAIDAIDARCPHEREVGRASADVDDENERFAADRVEDPPEVTSRREPVVERRLRLLEELGGEPGAPRGFDR